MPSERNVFRRHLLIHRFVQALDFACEVFQSTDELAGVGHFVVVPGNGFHQLFAAHGHHAGLGCVKERAVFDADNVGRNDLIFVVAVRFAGGGFHRGVDFFFGCRAFEDGNQFGQRAGGNRDALGEPSSLPFNSGITRPMALAA